jgi:hypothetical protein
MHQDLAFARELAKYQNKWVALQDKRVVASGTSVREVQEKVACRVVSLQRAGKYKKPASQPSQEQKGLDEKPLWASPWRSHPW